MIFQKLVLSFLCLFVTGVSFAADAGKIEVVGADQVDFGKYPAWEKKVARYQIRNAGKGDLKILKVRKTCGCASATADKDILKPGETGVVEVVILPNSIFKLYSKNTFVESSDTANRFLRLNVSGNATPLVEVSPKANVYAGRIKTKTPWGQAFVLKGGPDLVLGEPQVSSNYEMDVGLKKSGAGSYDLSLSMKPSEKSGDLKCSISVPVAKPLLKVGGVETNHQPVEISVTGRVGYELSVVPGIARMPISDNVAKRAFSFRVLGQRSRVLKPEGMVLPKRDDVEFKVMQERGGRSLKVEAKFSSEFSRKLFAEGMIPLEFSVPGAASTKVVCKSKK